MFAIERAVRERADNSRRRQLQYASGVVFPDIDFDTDIVEGDRDLVYDRGDRRRPVTQFLQRVANFARQNQPATRYAPNSEDRDWLVEVLRGDFDLIPPAKSVLADTTQQLLRLTKQQYQVLDVLGTRDRVVVEGGAGTGKTVLALEAAKRIARRGHRTLLLCYNRMLANELSDCVDDASDQLRVSSAHRLMRQLIRDSSHEDAFVVERQKHLGAGPGLGNDDQHIFGVLYPEFATYALWDRGPIADTLVIDEAQDLLTTENLDFLDAAVDGGLEAGRWFAFMDSNNQAALFGQLEAAALGRIDSNSSKFVLAANCRNTRQIATQLDIHTRPELRSIPAVDGTPVRFHFYSDQKDAQQRLERVLGDLDRAGVDPTDIVVLSPFRYERSSARGCNVRLAPDAQPGNSSRAFRFSSISAFKGLESQVVLLIDVAGMTGDWWRSALYVGMSRAQAELHVFLSEDAKKDYEMNLEDHMDNAEFAGDLSDA